jgi:hypothetical protein
MRNPNPHQDDLQDRLGLAIGEADGRTKGNKNVHKVHDERVKKNVSEKQVSHGSESKGNDNLAMTIASLFAISLGVCLSAQP